MFLFLSLRLRRGVKVSPDSLLLLHAPKTLECFGQETDDVRGGETLSSEAFGSEVAGESVQPYCRYAGVLLAVAPCQQSRQYAGEHVAASCRRHAGIAGVVEEHLSVGQTDGGVVAFEHDVAPQILCHLTRCTQTVEVAVTGVP